MYVITPIIMVSIIAHLILSALYKDVEKKDKGFVLGYYRLTYRRRLIRSLWGIPFTFLLYLTIYRVGDLTPNELKILRITFLLPLLLDIVHNYIKWKKND